MKRRLSKIEASQELGVSLSTIDRMIRREDLQIEREGTKSNDRVWVLMEDEGAAPADDPAVSKAPAPADDGASDEEVKRLQEQVRDLQGQVKELQGQVKGQQELADYRGELLKEGELRFHAVLQELSSSHRTVETLTKALPAAGEPEEARPRRRRWWPFGHGKG